MWCRLRGHMTSQYGAYALHAGLARLHAHAHTVGYPHARTHECARTYKRISNTYCFSKATIIRECASVLRYTYIACLFTNSLFSAVSFGAGSSFFNVRLGVPHTAYVSNTCWCLDVPTAEHRRVSIISGTFKLLIWLKLSDLVHWQFCALFRLGLCVLMFKHAQRKMQWWKTCLYLELMYSVIRSRWVL
jgi:hypothetical protein